MVQKLENEYRQETGQPLLTADDFIRWTHLLFDEKVAYYIFLHGKQPAGLLWGEERKDGTVEVHGRFLRPSFRKFRFKREFTKAWVDFRDKAGTLIMRVPPNAKSRHKVLWQTVAVRG